MLHIFGEPGHAIEYADLTLAKDASEKLAKHYPGHAWAVFVDSEGGVMRIKCFDVSSRYGWTLHLRHIYGDPDLKCVIRAGGEILERANLRRGWFNGDVPKVIDGVPRKHWPLKSGYII